MLLSGTMKSSATYRTCYSLQPPRPLPPSPVVLREGKNGSKCENFSKPPAVASENKLDCKLNGKVSKLRWVIG